MITAAETIGSYEAIPEADIFDIEYWSLEQAKLGKAREKPLAGMSRWSRAAGRGSAPRS